MKATFLPSFLAYVVTYALSAVIWSAGHAATPLESPSDSASVFVPSAEDVDALPAEVCFMQQVHDLRESADAERAQRDALVARLEQVVAERAETRRHAH